MSDAIQSAILAAFSAALERAISQAVATHVQDLQTRLDDLADRTAELETKLTEAALFAQTASITIDENRMAEALNSQEWFWEKLQNRIDAATESAIDAHCSDYDHDDYDSHVGDDDKHFDGDIEDAVRDALSNMSFDVTIR